MSAILLITNRSSFARDFALKLIKVPSADHDPGDGEINPADANYSAQKRKKCQKIEVTGGT